MKMGLLLLRSCMSWGHRAPYTSSVFQRRCASSFAGARSLCFVQPLTTRQRSSFQPYGRPQSSLSTSSFDAPEPPTSTGISVFPDIDFVDTTSTEHDAAKRNADHDAVFVVNGSSRGIGLQFVSSLADRTKGTIVACCRSPATAHELSEVAAKHPGRVKILPLDVEDQSSIDRLASIIARDYQRVDALFNVAGILGDGKTTPGPERSLANIEREWMEKTMAVNVIGPTMMAKALSPLMRTTGRKSVKMDVASEGGDDTTTLDVPLPAGRPPAVVVNLSARVGSISDNGLGGWYSYRISKSALNQATRTIALELKRQGTWAVALHPGTTNTDLSKPFQRNVKEGRLFPVEFTVEKLLAVVESMSDKNTGGFYDWAGKALPF